MALNKSGRALLCDLVNLVNPTSFTEDQVTIGTPQLFVDTLPGTHNTQVTFHANNAPDSVRTLYYTRLGLSTMFQSHDLEFEVDGSTTPASVLAEINAIFDTAIEMGVDIAPFTIPSQNGSVTLTALPTSLTYVGALELSFVYPAVAPVNTAAPVVSGDAVAGSELSVTNGDWTGTAPITYTRQWLADGEPIAGATGATYITVEEAGTEISCSITGTNEAGSVSAQSNVIVVEAEEPVDPESP